MYLEAIFSFYVFLYHFVGNSLFRLVRLGSFSDIIKRHFALSLAKLHFYADCAVRFFVGKQYNRLNDGIIGDLLIYYFTSKFSSSFKSFS